MVHSCVIFSEMLRGQFGMVLEGLLIVRLTFVSFCFHYCLKADITRCSVTQLLL